NENFILSGGTLTASTVQIADPFTLQGGTLRNATVSSTSGAELVATNSGGTLDGVTAGSDLDLASVNGANVHIVDGLTLNNATVRLGNAAGSSYGYLLFDNTETLGGTGTVLLGKSGSNTIYSNLSGASGVTLTIGPGITVRGSSGSLSNYYSTTIVNQ